MALPLRFDWDEWVVDEDLYFCYVWGGEARIFTWGLDGRERGGECVWVGRDGMGVAAGLKNRKKGRVGAGLGLPETH